MNAAAIIAQRTPDSGRFEPKRSGWRPPWRPRKPRNCWADDSTSPEPSADGWSCAVLPTAIHGQDVCPDDIGLPARISPGVWEGDAPRIQQRSPGAFQKNRLAESVPILPAGIIGLVRFSLEGALRYAQAPYHRCHDPVAVGRPLAHVPRFIRAAHRPRPSYAGGVTPLRSIYRTGYPA